MRTYGSSGYDFTTSFKTHKKMSKAIDDVVSERKLAGEIDVTRSSLINELLEKDPAIQKRYKKLLRIK